MCIERKDSSEPKRIFRKKMLEFKCLTKTTEDFQERIQELKRLARKASPGPWSTFGEKQTIVLAASGRVISDSTRSMLYRPTLMDRATGKDNAAFIASASPDLILQMIRELEKPRGEGGG